MNYELNKFLLPAVLAAASLPLMAQTIPSDTIKAQFPGGAEKLNEFIEANRRYPQRAINNGIEGVIDVRFLVRTDGNRDQLSIVRLVDPDLESEAIRLVNAMPRWIPASVGGIPVESQSEVQIPFLLPD